LLGYKPIGNIDLLEFSLIVFSILVLINLLFFSLFKDSQFNKLKILELLEQGIIVLNNKFEILYFNNSTEKYFNQNKSIELGANLLTSIDLSKEAVEILNKKIDKKCLQEINNNIIEVSIKYYYETEQYFILEFNDLTISQSTSVDFLKKIKDLEESNSLKDKLFSIITHDLKSPFASLLSMFHIADEDNFTHDDFKSFLPKITESIDYTSTLIDNLLSWCRSQINSIDFEIEEVKLKNIVDNEVSFFTFKANEKELKIVNELNTNDFVLADKDSLQLVFRNLFSNAIKFCKVGDSITVSYQVKEDRGTIVFKDTGVGMKNDSVEKLFGNEIFTTYGTNNEKGTGLGLLLSKDYVEKSGGQIFVESEIGIGTTFFITFPTKK
jgi:signal transduction histidine kinase